MVTVTSPDKRYNEDDLVKKAVEDLKISHTSVPIQKRIFRRYQNTSQFS